MKKRYIRQVERALTVSRRQRLEIRRDLEELFASAAENGEDETQVLQRLGSPAELARELEGRPCSCRAGRAGWRTALWSALAGAAGLTAFSLYGAVRAARVPENAIGFAQGSTGIRVQGAWDLSPLLLLAGAAALLAAALLAVRFIRRR